GGGRGHRAAGGRVGGGARPRQLLRADLAGVPVFVPAVADGDEPLGELAVGAVCGLPAGAAGGAGPLRGRGRPPPPRGAHPAAAGRGRAVRTPGVTVGVMAAAQLAAYALLQFAGSVQTLEQHYFSSTLWAGVGLVFAVAVGELARPLWGRRLARWLPAAALVA